MELANTVRYPEHNTVKHGTTSAATLLSSAQIYRLPCIRWRVRAIHLSLPTFFLASLALFASEAVDSHPRLLPAHISKFDFEFLSKFRFDSCRFLGFTTIRRRGFHHSKFCLWLIVLAFWVCSTLSVDVACLGLLRGFDEQDVSWHGLALSFLSQTFFTYT
jgi:hypothetical protein